MRSVSRWLPYTKIFDTNENQKLAEDMMENINTIFDALERPVRKSKRTKGETLV